MVEKILNNTTPYGKIRASHEGSLHSSTLNTSYDHVNSLCTDSPRIQGRSQGIVIPTAPN